MNIEFDFLFRECASIKFFGSASFLKFSPITKPFDAAKHHNPGTLFSWNYVISWLWNFATQEIWKRGSLT